MLDSIDNNEQPERGWRESKEFQGVLREMASALRNLFPDFEVMLRDDDPDADIADKIYTTIVRPRGSQKWELSVQVMGHCESESKEEPHCISHTEYLEYKNLKRYGIGRLIEALESTTREYLADCLVNDDVISDLTAELENAGKFDQIPDLRTNLRRLYRFIAGKEKDVET